MKVAAASSLPLVLLLVLLGLLYAPQTRAHEIEPHVHLTAYVKVMDGRLDVAVRVPLVALRDLSLPVTAAGHLDEARAADALANGAWLWIVNELSIFAGEQVLREPDLLSARASPPADRAYRTAQTVWQAPVSSTAGIPWQHLNLDVRFSYPLTDEQVNLPFSLASNWARLGVVTETTLTFIGADADAHTLTLSGNAGRVYLQPGPARVSGLFSRTGFRTMLEMHTVVLLIVAVALMIRSRHELLTLLLLMSGGMVVGGFATNMMGLPLWFNAMHTAVIAVLILLVCLLNVLPGRALPLPLSAVFTGLLAGAGLVPALRLLLPHAGLHDGLAVFGFLAGATGFVLLLAGATGALILFAAPRLANRQPGLLRQLTIIAAVIIAHSAWHWLESQLGVLSEYNLFT